MYDYSECENYINYHLDKWLDDSHLFFDMFLDNVISIFTIDKRIPLKLILNIADTNKYNNLYKYNISEVLETRALEEISYIAHINGVSKIQHYYKNGDIFIHEKNSNQKIYLKNNKYYLECNDYTKVFIKGINNISYLSEIKDKNNIMKIEYNSLNQIIKIMFNNYIYDINYKKNQIIINDNIINYTLINKSIKTLSINNTKYIYYYSKEDNKVTKIEIEINNQLFDYIKIIYYKKCTKVILDHGNKILKYDLYGKLI